MHYSNTFGSIQFLKSFPWNPLKPFLKYQNLSVFHNMYAFGWIKCNITRSFKGTIRGPDTVCGNARCPLENAGKHKKLDMCG